MALELQILGSNSAAFAHSRHHTSQLLRIQEKYFLVDCGEGTQMLIKKYKIKLSRINTILISHLHGDHYYGLIGLLSTLHLYGRKTVLKIFGPPGLRDIISLQLKYSETRLTYDIDFREWEPNVSSVIYEDDKMMIKTVPLEHRVSCSGYLFQEKPKSRRIRREAVEGHLTPSQVNLLKMGEDVYNEDNQLIYDAKLVTLPPYRPFSYAFCSDTRYKPSLIETLNKVDLVYHEATFMHDMLDRAQNTYHTTARQAAELARDANIGKLLLGHFSTRYRDLNPLLVEARQYFENTELAIEGEKFVVSE